MALTTAFVAAVRRQGSIPSNYPATDILALADEEIQSTFIPLLTDLRSNFFVRTIDIAADARGKYPLPPRAIGAALRSVQLYTGNGWFPLTQRDPADADYVSASALPDAYFVDAGSIVLLPTGSTGSLRVRYAARPGQMCLDTDTNLAARLTTVSAPGATTTAIIGGYTGPLANCDIVSSGPAHQQKAIGAAIGGVTPNLTVTNTDLLEQPIVGDYIALADRSPFVPIPEELYSALKHKVAANILLTLGYLEEATTQEGKAEKASKNSERFLKPRNEGNPPRVKGGLRRALGVGGRRGRR